MQAQEKAAKGKALISIKGLPQGLVFYFNTKAGEFKDLCAALEEKLLEQGNFFAGAIYFLRPESPFSPGEERIIHEIMSAYRLEKGSEEASKPAPDSEIPGASAEYNEGHCFYHAQKGDSVMLMRSLRSGQQVAVKGNAVLLGDVNSGAELKASGHIIVMGNCRGILHAGAEGDREAFIVAYRLQAHQIRIADTAALIAPPPKGRAPQVQKAALEGDTIVVRDYPAFKHIAKAEGLGRGGKT